MSFFYDALYFFYEEICFHFFYISECRQFLLYNFCFGISHNVTKFIDFFSYTKCKGFTCSAGTSCSANTMHIIFFILRYIIIEYHVNIVNINSSCGNICGNQYFNGTVSEFLHNFITLRLF